MSKIGNWTFSDVFDAIRDENLKFTLEVDSIVKQMTALENEVTLRAVVSWLRERGWTLLPPEDYNGDE